MQLDSRISEFVWTGPERMSGAPCIRGTRIRVSDLFDWLAGGGSLDEFLETFPHVDRRAAIALVRLAEEDLLAHLSQAA